MKLHTSKIKITSITSINLDTIKGTEEDILKATRVRKEEYAINKKNVLIPYFDMAITIKKREGKKSTTMPTDYINFSLIYGFVHHKETITGNLLSKY